MKKKNIILLAVVFCCAIGIVFWWLNKTAFQTPHQLAPMPAEEFADNPALKMKEGELSLFSPNLNTGTVKAFIESLSSPDKMYWKTKYQIFSGDSTLTYFAEYYNTEKGQWVNQLSEKGKTVITTTLYSRSVTKRNRETGERFSSSALMRNTPSMLLHMPDMQYFYTLAPEDIATINFEDYNEQPALYLEFLHPDLQITEKYWISTEYGVPLKAETYIDGVLSVSTTTEEINGLGKSSGA